MSAEWLLANEGPLRLGIFLGVLGLMLLLQRRFPLRGDGRWSRRQAVNAGMVLIGTLLLRLAVPVLAVGWALKVSERGWGLLPALGLDGLALGVIAVLLLDLAIYWQHRLFHRIPWLWRLHRVHHSDTAFDTTTGVRFHPLELLLSLVIKLVVIALLGAPGLAVLVFEILLSSGALFTHADFALPQRLDRRLRWLFVTPSMHRVHHSPHRHETDSNYGFHLSLWDRLFRSYRAAPAEPESRMTIGLADWRSTGEQRLFALLRQPLQRPARTTPEDHDA
ncbi:sterol desaturase family protein [Pseudomarimonas salicorniae]|uniref:Sterol desaturase family protein n=1 Tax=Pseudomarimonas salicorniae TaxID=2933270 RepID=A0ABT0GKM9_9GAMM|nr:sterol desaturase family protein [Lysobacter sp. CAU 1642]MCK7595104.1 sterol desaturase family protein [Lysobacter sp. CAU 1642]